MCLNTGYPRHVAERLVSVLGLKVDGLVVAEDVGHGRPYPYMIHHLMKQFLVSLFPFILFLLFLFLFPCM